MLISTECFLPLSPSVSIHLPSLLAGSAPPRQAELRELQGLSSLFHQQKSPLRPPQGENTLLGAGLGDWSPPAPNGSKDRLFIQSFYSPKHKRTGFLSWVSTAPSTRGSYWFYWGKPVKPSKGWQISGACPAIKEANTHGRSLKGEKMVTDAGTLGALIQSHLSAGLRLSPSNPDLFLPLFTPSFSADTSVLRSRRVLSAKCGVLRSAKQHCSKAKKQSG